MDLEQKIKKRQEFQNKLLKHKQTIQKIMNKTTSPKSQTFNSTLFRAIQDQTITNQKNTYSYNQNQTNFEINQSNSYLPQVNNQKQLSVLNTINQVLNKKMQGTTFSNKLPIKKQVQKIQNTQQSLQLSNPYFQNIQKTIRNTKKYNLQVKQSRQLESKSPKVPNLLSQKLLKSKDLKLTKEQSKKQQKKSGLPPKPFQKKKDQIQSTLQKFRETANDLQKNPLTYSKHQTQQNFFDLSQSIQIKSLISNQQQWKTQKQNKIKEDQILIRLYQQRENLVSELKKIEQEIKSLQHDL